MSHDVSKGQKAEDSDAKALKEKVDAEMEQLRKEAAAHKESLQRLQAEFENYKKRIDREKAASALAAKAEFVKCLLPVLDSFEMGLKSSSEREKFAKGVEMIYAQLCSAL